MSGEWITKTMISPKSVGHASHPNNYFDRIYAISLDRRPERWAQLRAQLVRFGVKAERFSAIDAHWPETKEIYQRLIARQASSRRRIRSCSELGCLLSHIHILEDARRHGHRRILVLEDDVCLHKWFLREFEKVSWLPENWALLFLGASQYRWSGVRQFDDTFYLANTTFGAFAVAYDRSIYDMVLKTWRRLDQASDEGLTEVQRKFPGRCFVFKPNLVIADVRKSDLRAPRHQARHARRMRWDLALYHLPVRTNRQPM